MVTHDGARITLVHHAPRDLEHAKLLRSAIDQVAQEDELAANGRPVAATVRDVTHLAQQAFEFVRVSVHVSNDVVALYPVSFEEMRESSQKACKSRQT